MKKVKGWALLITIVFFRCVSWGNEFDRIGCQFCDPPQTDDVIACIEGAPVLQYKSDSPGTNDMGKMEFECLQTYKVKWFVACIGGFPKLRSGETNLTGSHISDDQTYASPNNEVARAAAEGCYEEAKNDFQSQVNIFLKSKVKEYCGKCTGSLTAPSTTTPPQAEPSPTPDD